ncbi:MAG: hypothetical protein JRL30_06560 [Deltaproteobacteria bacterium]|nr:hypothetical protein [Deltaproteobacteria bacterium]
MKRGIFQLIVLSFLVLLCIGGFFLGKTVIELPFRATNDALHKEGAPVTLDFLIPGGAYVDEQATIGDVVRVKLKKGAGPFEKVLRAVSDRIPPTYRYLGNTVFFFFWALCFMTFLRVFTFMGYARALRISLLFGGITYYFMPDLSPGAGDDLLFVLFPVLIILVRFYWVRRSKGKRAFKKD